MKNNLLKKYGDTDFITSLRAFAILGVYLIHSGGFGLRNFGEWGNFIVSCGKYGVQVFFVISGYTIFYQLFKRKYTLKKFLLVRILRISIAYYPIILLLFLYNKLGGFQFNYWANQINNGNIDLPNLFSHVFYYSTYNLKWQNTIIGVEWTLGIEVFYYFLFGLLIAFNILTGKKKRMMVFAVISFIFSLTFSFIYKILPIDRLYNSWLPFKYLFMFFLGGASYFLRDIYSEYDFKTNIKKETLSDLLIIAIVLAFVGLTFANSMFDIPYFKLFVEYYFALSTFLILFMFKSSGSISKLLLIKPLQFLGSFSYSFYLLHYIVILVVPDFSQLSFINGITKLILSLFISYAFAYVFENRLYSIVKNKINNLK